MGSCLRILVGFVFLSFLLVFFITTFAELLAKPNSFDFSNNNFANFKSIRKCR